MGRYLRLYACFLRFSFSRAMQFRLDFFFRVGMDSLWYAQYLAFFAILYLHTDRLGGWTREQALVFTATLFVVDAVQMTVFSNNMWQFPLLVNKGDLDYHLVRPVSTLFFVSLRDFAANSFLNLLMAAGVLVWALASYPAAIPAPRVALFLGLLPVGILVHFCLQLGFTLPVFWMHSGSGLRDLYWTLDVYVARPEGIYRGWVRQILTSLLPLAAIVSFPVRALFDPEPLWVALHLVAIAAVAFAVLLLVWRRGLRAYSSASS